MFCLLQAGGLLLVVPEHRLSLQLKWQELWLKGDAASRAVCAELEALAAMPFLDLLDESDELLHHRCRHTPAACIDAPHSTHLLPTPLLPLPLQVQAGVRLRQQAANAGTP